MRESLIELGLCLLIALLSLAVVVWVVVTGRIAYLDGILLALISLTIGVFFLFDVVISYRRGELQELLGRRKGLAPGGESGKSSASATSSAEEQ
jgi:hypothetical protein